MNKPEEIQTAAGRDDGGMVSPWRGTTPELLIAAVAVAVAAVAAYATASWAGLTVVAVATAAGVMVLLRALLPQLTPDAAKKAREKPRARTLTGYSHRGELLGHLGGARARGRRPPPDPGAGPGRRPRPRQRCSRRWARGR